MEIDQRFRKALFSLLTASNPFSSSNKCEKESMAVDCCICLSGIGPFQALFLSPCSHCFHFKCIRHIISETGQMFPCPVCRQVANLEASVSMESLFEDELPPLPMQKEEFKLGNPLPFSLTLQTSSEIKEKIECDDDTAMEYQQTLSARSHHSVQVRTDE